jgi:hypothetical protein
MSKTKGEIVTAAFRKAQISGITTQPTGDELAGAVETLEDMMRELESKNACTTYTYEDSPCLATESNLDQKWYHAVQSRLAVLLCSDFGLQPSPTLMAQSRQAWTSMIGKLTKPRQIGQTRRMPRGSGNTFRAPLWVRYYQGETNAPIDCDTINIKVDEVYPVTIDFSGYLTNGEAISSFVIKDSTGGVTITQSQATENMEGVELVAVGKREGAQSLVVEIATTMTRVYPEKIWFQVEGL